MRNSKGNIFQPVVFRNIHAEKCFPNCELRNGNFLSSKSINVKLCCYCCCWSHRRGIAQKKTYQSNRVQQAVRVEFNSGLAVRQGRQTNKRHGFCSGLCRSNVAAFFSPSPATKHPPSDPDGWKPLYFTASSLDSGRKVLLLARTTAENVPSRSDQRRAGSKELFLPAE